MSAELCPDCGRPIAGDEDDAIGEATSLLCFRRFDPESREGTDFEALCLRLAVKRLQLHAPRGGVLQTTAHERMATALERIAASLETLAVVPERLGQPMGELDAEVRP